MQSLQWQHNTGSRALRTQSQPLSAPLHGHALGLTSPKPSRISLPAPAIINQHSTLVQAAPPQMAAAAAEVPHWAKPSREQYPSLSQPLSGPAVWTAKDVLGPGKDKEWTTWLSEAHIQELEAAVQGLVDQQLIRVDGNYVRPARELSKADFPLPTLAPVLAQLAEEVSHGRGFALVKGLPVDRWTRLQSVMALHGMGLHWGRARPQNKKAHLVGHVKDTGIDPDHKDPTTRIYLTRVAQPWHVDSTDMVGLMCLKTAAQGGMSSWCSSYAALNKVMAQSPELAQVLAGPWFLDRKNEVPQGKGPAYCLPIVNVHEGVPTVYFNDTYYQLAQRHPEVPRLTPQQTQALDAFREAAMSDELRVDYWLEPGDLQLLNNHCMLHTRTAFTDHEDPARKRHLLRLWVALPQGLAWPLAPEYAEVYHTTEVGIRGGVRIQGFEECIPLEAE